MMWPLPLLTLLFTLTFVGSAFVTSFDGFNDAQLPIPQVDPPIQPPGWSFSIWGLIYAGLLASAAFGLWRRREDAAWDRARRPLVVSLAAGTPWLAVASRSAVWASLLIAVMAATAIAAFLAAPPRDRLLLRVPLGLYAGWLTAAAFVSLGTTMAGFGLLLGERGWAFAGIPLALAMALAVQWPRPGALEYGFAVAWAFLGIALKNAATYPGVTLLAIGAMAVIKVAALRPPAFDARDPEG